MTNVSKKLELSVPEEVSQVTGALKKAGFEAYLVGGCTRDLLLGRKPKDWDITTNAKPDQIQKIFKDTFYENDYGTVGVVNEKANDESLKVIEVTPYRLEAAYSDSRRPDSVTWSETLEKDLDRRDFTINAIAYDAEEQKIVDPHNGRKDIADEIIKTVGKPEDRFNEDALRIVRAVRLHAELGFKIETGTAEAIKRTSEKLKKISVERIRDEFTRIIMSDNPMEGIITAHNLAILSHILPELEEGIGTSQPQAHKYDVWEHILRAVQCSADKKWPLEIRLATILHDIAKPPTRKVIDGQITFYGHEVVGAKMSFMILQRLKYPRQVCEKVSKLVRWHMFFSDTEQISLSAVRRIVSRVGKENIWDLMNIRVCDRVGTGRPKENPYRLRKYKSMIEEVMRDPISVGMLKIDGKKIMEVAGLQPGPKIGFILHMLLEEVLEDPKLNTEEYLSKKAKELAGLSDSELEKMGREAKEKKDEMEEGSIEEIRKRHGVK